MIPPDVSEWIFPELATGSEDTPTIELPCGGIALKFIISSDVGSGEDRDLSWDEFRAWKVSLDELAEIAGINSFGYNTWKSISDGVYENCDNCWPSFVLSPGSILEHNEVSGRPVIYIVDEHTAILTGDRCQTGLAQIQSKMAIGLAQAPMVINADWRTWSRFNMPKPTA